MNTSVRIGMKRNFQAEKKYVKSTVNVDGYVTSLQPV